MTRSVACFPLSLLFFGAGAIRSQAAQASRLVANKYAVHDILVDFGWEFHGMDARDAFDAVAFSTSTNEENIASERAC
jgi:hypothetical protein